MLGREEILKADERLKLVKVSVPEWTTEGAKDPHVWVRQLSAGVALSVAEKFSDEDADKSEIVDWCIIGVCDDKGEPIFAETDRPALLRGPVAPLMRCSQAIADINGLGDLEGN